MSKYFTYKTGVYVWGVLLVAWLAFVVIGILQPPDTSLYVTLKDHGSLAAALTAVLGVIWSWFLQLDSKAAADRQKKQ